MGKQAFRRGSSAHCTCFSCASYDNSVVNDWYLTRTGWKRCLQLECSELFLWSGVLGVSEWFLVSIVCGMVFNYIVQNISDGYFAFIIRLEATSTTICKIHWWAIDN